MSLLCGAVSLTSTFAGAEPSPITEILFTSGTPAQLRILNTSTGSVRQITKGTLAHRHATWSPDGRRIAFLGVPQGMEDASLYVVDAGGQGAKRVASAASLRSKPAWSPDSTRIAFLSHEVDAGAEVVIVGRDGDNARPLTNDGSPKTALSWSHDGRHLVFVASYGGVGEVTIIDASSEVTKTIGFGSQPRWSPRRSVVAYIARTLNGRQRITAFDVQSGQSHSLLATPAGQWLRDPSWSLDGRHLAVVRGRANSASTSVGVLVSLRKYRRLTTLSRHLDLSPVWSPNSRRIAFLRHRFGESDIARIAIVLAEGGPVRIFRSTRLRLGVLSGTPEWRPQSQAR